MPRLRGLHRAWQARAVSNRVQPCQIDGCAAEKCCQPAGCDDFDWSGDFRLHSPKQSFDQPDIAPIDTDLHLPHGVAPDHALRRRRFNRDARQHRCCIVQRVERQVDPRGNAAAQIGSIGADMVECRRRAKTDDDLVDIRDQLLSGNRVDGAVRAQRRGSSTFSAMPQPTGSARRSTHRCRNISATIPEDCAARAEQR
jgi:hypothetical protein